MSRNDEQLNKNVLDDVIAAATRLKNNLSKCKKSLNTWELKNLERLLAVCGSDLNKLIEDWEEKIQAVNQESNKARGFIGSEFYSQELEEALKKVGVPLRGSFPVYEFPPFKLTVDLSEEVVKLSLGRKQERSTSLLPGEVAVWVGKRYDKVVKRKIDSQRFCRDLLAAYERANSLIYKSENVLWGKAVPLNMIYDLLTLRLAAKSDYPKDVFTYELARLREQFEIRYKEYRFELGHSRNTANSLLLIDAQGRETRVSSLIVHREGSR